MCLSYRTNRVFFLIDKVHVQLVIFYFQIPNGITLLLSVRDCSIGHLLNQEGCITHIQINCKAGK